MLVATLSYRWQEQHRTSKSSGAFLALSLSLSRPPDSPFALLTRLRTLSCIPYPLSLSHPLAHSLLSPSLTLPPNSPSASLVSIFKSSRTFPTFSLSLSLPPNSSSASSAPTRLPPFSYLPFGIRFYMKLLSEAICRPILLPPNSHSTSSLSLCLTGVDTFVPLEPPGRSFHKPLYPLIPVDPPSASSPPCYLRLFPLASWPLLWPHRLIREFQNPLCGAVPPCPLSLSCSLPPSPSSPSSHAFSSAPPGALSLSCSLPPSLLMQASTPT